jgi:ribosomal protein L39E
LILTEGKGVRNGKKSRDDRHVPQWVRYHTHSPTTSAKVL